MENRAGILQLSPRSILTACCLFYGSAAVMCWGKPEEEGVSAWTWEPLANPPPARHGTFAEQGPPTLKACSWEQTQQCDLPSTGRSISGESTYPEPLWLNGDGGKNRKKRAQRRFFTKCSPAVRRSRRTDLPVSHMETWIVHRSVRATGVYAGSSGHSRKRRAPFGTIGAGCQMSYCSYTCGQ